MSVQIKTLGYGALHWSKKPDHEFTINDLEKFATSKHKVGINLWNVICGKGWLTTNKLQEMGKKLNPTEQQGLSIQLKTLLKISNVSGTRFSNAIPPTSTSTINATHDVGRNSPTHAVGSKIIISAPLEEPTLPPITEYKRECVDDDILGKKIVAFLEHDLKKCTDKGKIDDSQKMSETEIEDRQKVINYFKNNKGFCAGLTTLWLYGKRISDDENVNKKERDDIDTFYKAQQMLAGWDEKKSFDPKDKAEIERFVGNVRFFQENSAVFFSSDETVREHAQTNLSLTLDDTKRGAPVEVFHPGNRAYTKEMLRARLPEIIKTQTMIFLSSEQDTAGHVTGAYRSAADNKIYFFNSQKGEQEVDLDTVTDIFWNAMAPQSDRLDIIGQFARNMDFKVFRFSNDPVEEYPEMNTFTKVTKEEFIEHFASENGGCLDNRITQIFYSMSQLEHFELYNSETTPSQVKEIIANNYLQNLLRYNADNVPSSYKEQAKMFLDQPEVLGQMVQKQWIKQTDIEKLQLLK